MTLSVRDVAIRLQVSVDAARGVVRYLLEKNLAVEAGLRKDPVRGGRGANLYTFEFLPADIAEDLQRLVR